MPTMRAQNAIAYALLSILLSVTLSVDCVADELAFVRGTAQARGIEAGAQGNAWLFNRGGQCFAATPKHVLINSLQGRDDHYARMVVVRPGRSAIEAEGDRCAVFKTLDLALLRVSGVADMADCGHVLAGVPSIDSLLERTAQSSLLTAIESGRFERSTLEIRSAAASDTYHFWVASANDRDRLTEGMSGGLVSIQNQLAGFLLAVDTSSVGPMAGMARVLRADRAATLVARVLDTSGASDDAEGSCVTPGSWPAAAPAAAGVTVGLRAGRASPACGATIASWSAPPLSEATRPDNLLGAGGDRGRWRATVTSELTVDLRLCPSSRNLISRIRLDTSECAAGDNSALDVEVLVRTDSSGVYATLGYGTVPISGTADVGSASPLFGREMRIRLVPRHGVHQSACLGPLSVD